MVEFSILLWRRFISRFLEKSNLNLEVAQSCYSTMKRSPASLKFIERASFCRGTFVVTRTEHENKVE